MDSALTTVGLPIALGIIMFGLGLSLTPDGLPAGGPAPARGGGGAGLPARAAARGLLRAGQAVRPAAAAGGRDDAAGGLAGRDQREPVQPPLPGRRRAQRHPDRGELGDRDRVAAADHQPRDRSLRPRRQREPAVRQGGRGLRDRAGAGRRSGCWCCAKASGVGGSGWTGRCGSARRRSWRCWCSGILLDQRENVGDYLADVGPGGRGRSARSAWSPGTSYRGRPACATTQAIASSMEIGVHNATLAIFVAVEVLDSTEISVPAAVYSIFMFVFATLWGAVLSRRIRATGPRAAPAP